MIKHLTNKNTVVETIFPTEGVIVKAPLYKDDPLDTIGFPVRTLNILIVNGYETVEQFYVAPIEKLLKLRNIGSKSIDYFIKIREELSKYFDTLPYRPAEIVEISEQTPKAKISHTPYLSDLHKERMKLVKRLYDEYGTLDKVGSLLRLSRERVRQILDKGQRYGLFSYELTRDKIFDKILNRIDKEQLRGLISSTKNQFDICLKLEIDINMLQRLIRYYEIDVQSYKQDARYKRYLNEYSEIVRTLGYHPSTTVLQQNRQWRRIAVGIDRLWGGFDKFRNEFGIEKPKRMVHPNTMVAWNLAKQKRMNIKKERMKSVLKIVDEFGPISCREIYKKTGIGLQNVYAYLKELIENNLVIMVGRGYKVKYILRKE